MRCAVLALAVAICAVSVAPAAFACAAAVPADRLPGETDAQWIERGRRIHQDGLRAAADSVFLAQVSAAKMVNRIQADYALTPFFPLYDTVPPAGDVTLRDSPVVTGCTIRPELGRVYVVYAERTEDGWRVNQIVGHDDLRDRPPGMPTARDVARGHYDLPTYAE